MDDMDRREITDLHSMQTDELEDRIAELERENRDLRLYLDTIYEKHGDLFFDIRQYGHWREKQEGRMP